MKKNIIVTGGSRGIGKGIVEILAKQGHNIILNYNKSEEKAKIIKENLEKEKCNIEIFKADVSNREEVKKLIEFSIKKLGTIDVLVNNAGIGQVKMFTEITDEDWDNMIKNNLTSIFYTTQEAIKNMISNKSGCIINISSIWGLIGGSCEVHYSASKAGIDGMTKALAKEMGPSNIRINSIAPGCTKTEMLEDVSEEEFDQIRKETPLNKIGKVEDIAKCVKWLVEDEFTTGQVISINGGWVIT